MLNIGWNFHPYLTKRGDQEAPLFPYVPESVMYELSQAKTHKEFLDDFDYWTY